MVKLKFIIRSGVLALRISAGQDRYYKRVAHLLKGQPDLKHWKQDKEMFSGYAEFYKENNQILEDFKSIYWKLIQQHPELSARQVAVFYKAEQKQTGSKPVKVNDWGVSDYRNSVSKYLEVVIKRERAKQGCNYEAYYKLLNRCRRDIVGFDDMPFSTIDYNQMVTIAYIFAREPSYRNISKTFRALLGKAHKDPDVMFRLNQIGDFRFCDYSPNKYDVETKHPDILDSECLRAFLNADPYYLTPEYKNRATIELYYDFCVFMFHSFFAPCDVIKARLRDITNRKTLLVRRKKTHRPVEVPISPAMQRIIDKYRGQSKGGYIFPIMDDELERTSKTKDFCLKKFRERLNAWLKPVGKALGLDYELYAYVFRHTAITVAIDSGLPVSYVSNAAGTSVEMIQKHYYNGDNQQNRDLLTEAFMSAAK
jgi:integrase